MGFILVPANGEDCYVNIWSWHPTVELLVRADIIPPDRAERLHSNCGAEVTAPEAASIADYLTEHLARLSPDERLLIDGATTREPAAVELHRGDDWDKNYSATHEWLTRFRDFCRASGGFSVL